jgi:hypothetical protein
MSYARLLDAYDSVYNLDANWIVILFSVRQLQPYECFRAQGSKSKSRVDMKS